MAIDFIDRVHKEAVQDFPVHHMDAIELKHDAAYVHEPHGYIGRQVQPYDNAHERFC